MAATQLLIYNFIECELHLSNLKSEPFSISHRHKRILNQVDKSVYEFIHIDLNESVNKLPEFDGRLQLKSIYS